MVQTTRPNAAEAERRVVFLDLLRLIAAFQMVQGHTLDALLSSQLRHGIVFRVWSFVRGLTSCTFLVCAGIAFALAIRSGAAAGRSRRTRRAFMLIALGYAMHAPLGLLLGEPLARAVRGFMVVDVLQCIGVTLLSLELLSWGLTNPRRLAASCCLLGTLCFVLAPITDSIFNPHLGASWLVGNYFSARGGSLFPLLPWSGFVFWGTGVGIVLTRLLTRPKRAALLLAGSGLAAGLLAALLQVALPALERRVSPAFSLMRLGLVLLFAAGLLGSLEGKLRLPRWLRALASETLILYVGHVVPLYATGVGLVYWVGPTLPLGAALSVVLLVLVSCGGAALGWARLKRALRVRGGGGTPRAQQPADLGILR